MLKKSLDFGVKHDLIGAVVFFVTHLVLVTGLIHIFGTAGILEGIVGSVFEGGDVHTIIGSLFVLWVGGSILHHRGLTNDVLSVVVVIASIYLAWTMTPIIALAPIALLTTLGKK